jgi:hypothetical protein
MLTENHPFCHVVEFNCECFPEVIASLIGILHIRESGITDGTEAGGVFLVLEPTLEALPVHFPGPHDDPRNAEPVDRADQLCACSLTVAGNPEVQTLAETYVVPRVMKLVFEMDQVHIHLHGHLQTKEELPG